MIAHLTIGFVVATVFLLWLAIRTWGRERIALYALIPILLGLASASWLIVHSLLGFPTRDFSDLQEGFVYLHHVGEDPVWLTAVPAGAEAPRLYEIPASELSEQGRKGMTEAGMRGERGIPTHGTYSGGEWQFHEVDPPEGSEKPRRQEN